MLYNPEYFEPLVEEAWGEGRVRDAIAAIVADTDAAFDADALWPAYVGDVYREGERLNALYSGAAGVVWALDLLRRNGYAETTLDLGAAAVRALELEHVAAPAREDEHHTPASLFDGETGPLLVAFRLTGDAALADDLHGLVLGNFDNPTDDISWGAPGTQLAALGMHEWTGDQRWLDAAHGSATALRARRKDGVWRQDDDYHGLSTLHGVAGNTLALLRVEPDDELTAESAEVLARHAVREDGLANWPGAADRPTLVRRRDGRICVQWCTGAPGVLCGAWSYLDEELVLAGAELVWQAGAHGDEKGAGLCHGTAGNGYTLLRAFARTGDERWLERARRFAVHALLQADRLATANGGRRHSLFTGDLGAALFAVACLDADTRFPVIDVI